MAAAHRTVFRQVENELHNKDAQEIQQKNDVHKVRPRTKRKVQQNSGSAAYQHPTASKRGAMRRSGRAGGATVNYKEDSDPIEDCSSDEAGDDKGVDQAPPAARKQPARQQQKQSVRSGVDYTSVDSEDEAEPAAATKGTKEQQQQQGQRRQRRTAAVISDGDDDDAPAPGSSADDVEDASEPEEQQQDSDSDFEERPAAKKRLAATAAAGRRKGRSAAAAVSEEEDADEGDASEEDEIEDYASEDGEQQQRQQRRSRCNAGAAVARTAQRGSSARRSTRGQQQQAADVPRRSTRGAAAAAAGAVDAADEPARPRRAAAAAATAATAAALMNEQQLRFGGSSGSTDADSDNDDDLGSAGDSEEEHEALLGSEEGSSDAADDEHDESGSEGWEDGSSDGGSSKQRRAAAAAAGSRPVPRRPRGRSASSADDADEQDDEHGGSEDDDEAGEQDGLPSLDAFRFDSSKPTGRRQARKSASPAAAAGSGGSPEAAAAAAAGKAKAGSGSSRPGRASPQSALAKAQAVREHAEADAAEVADPALFEPQLVARLPRGAEIEKVLRVRYLEDNALQALLKLKGKAYRATVWASSAQVEKAGKAALLRNFISKQNTDGSAEVDIDPRWYQVERVLEEYVHRKSGEREYLVKWSNLDYSDATWEPEEEVARDGQGRAALARFKLWCTPPAVPPRPAKRPAAALCESGQLPVFRNGRALRDYQETSLQWMVNNYRGEVRNGKWWPRNCILGDEMGLGKTAQSIAVMAWLKQYAGVTAPFVVVAPLTTLGHWQREIQTWTGMNVVLYTGSANDRRLIRDTEFYYPSDRTVKQVMGCRFDVLLTSYETVLKDKTELKKLNYAALILDEAHRLKSRTSATRAALLELPVHWWLLLSGTPVQNNMRELQGLMSVLDEEAYGDLESFTERFGDERPSLEQIRALQAALAPVLLRRMKEDVEDLPEKEEVVIWVELTQEQRRYYRALYSKQIGSLLQGVAAKNLPGMRNLAMELRKLCCHPFLCDGLEEDMTARWEATRAAAAAEGAAGLQKEVEALTRASGKMLLLHKLLPKLRAEGRQVLIFSQFKMMLDVLEDYLAASDYPFERIDGDTNHKDRQAAIDRFMAAKDRKPSRSTSPAAAEAAASAGSGAAAGSGCREGSVAANAAAAADEGGPFVFLLSTRAGGQGITLTSADTVIIYDSDWNPQNDLQAMARCHRIGQDREVTVYRLVSKATYEQQLFECASRKYGLDEAILGFGGGENPENDAARIEQLLRLGAHAIAGGAEEDAGGEDKGMAAEGIDQILAGRSEKRQLGSRKGNTFSIAHFAAGGAEPELPEAAEAEAEPAAVDAKAFWAELLPEAVQAHEAAAGAAKEPEVLGPRRRTVVNYKEKGYRFDSDGSDSEGPGGRRRKRVPADDADDFDAAAAEGEAGDDDMLPHKKKHKKREAGDGPVHDPELGRVVQHWSGMEAATLARAWLRFGPDRLDKLTECGSRDRDEVQQLLRALSLLLDELSRLPETQPPKKAAAAAGTGDGDGAAADAAKEDAASRAQRHGALPVHTVHAIQEGLSKAGVADKLPPACRKALLQNSMMQTLARNPAALKQQVEEHRKVHAAVVKAGILHPTTSKPAAAAAGEGTPKKQEAQDSGATPAAAAMKSPSKRSRLVPKVPLRGFKQLPAWWCRDHDERLLLGSYKHGYSSHLRPIMEDILADFELGFCRELALDPVAVAAEAHPPPPPPPPPAAPTPAAAGGEAAAAAPQQTVVQQQWGSSIPPAVLARAKAQKEAMLATARARNHNLQLYSPSEWKKLFSALMNRLRKVRCAMLDPNFVEAPTPSKPKEGPVLNLSKTPGSAPGTAPGSSAPAAQQRLHLTPMAVAMPVMLAGGAQVMAMVGQRPTPQQQQLAKQLHQQLQQRHQQQQLAGVPAAVKAATAAHAAAAAAQASKAAVGQGVKRQAAEQVQAEDSDDFRPSKQQQRGPGASGGAAAAAAANKPQQAAAGKQQPAEVVDLASEDSPPPPSAAAAAAAGAAGKQQPAAAPSSGLMVKRVTASQLSDRSVEVDEPSAAAPADSDCTPASNRLHSSGKQQMQQLLGSSERAAGEADSGSAGQQAAAHPVYGGGTPTEGDAAAAAAGGKRKAKAMKEDNKQRKLSEFFSAKK